MCTLVFRPGYVLPRPVGPHPSQPAEPWHSPSSAWAYSYWQPASKQQLPNHRSKPLLLQPRYLELWQHWERLSRQQGGLWSLCHQLWPRKIAWWPWEVGVQRSRCLIRGRIPLTCLILKLKLCLIILILQSQEQSFGQDSSCNHMSVMVHGTVHVITLSAKFSLFSCIAFNHPTIFVPPSSRSLWIPPSTQGLCPSDSITIEKRNLPLLSDENRPGLAFLAGSKWWHWL